MNHKYLRRLTALLCAAVLLLGLCGSAFAAESKSDDYRYSVNADGSLTLTAYTGSEHSLHIPAELDGKPVTAIGESCFAGLLNLERVYVPEGVTELGSYAFECCADLQKTYLPDSLRRIGEGAFSGCAALSLVDIQDGLESIGRGAFLCCDSLVQLELPESLAELGDFAFAECEALSSVRFLGSGVTVLPDRLFHGCVSLNRLALPQSVSVIGKRAFSGCEALTNLYFGQELTGLGAYAFENCKRLSTLTVKAEAIPEGLAYGCEALRWFNLDEGVRSLGYRAFGGTGIDSLSLPASLEEIAPGAFYQMRTPCSLSLGEGNGSFRLAEGSLYSADGKTLIAYFTQDPYAEEPQTVCVLPEGVETVGAFAFAGCELSDVVFPASLQRIEAHAFADTNLENLEIPQGVQVDPKAFLAPGQEEESQEPGEPEEPGEDPVPEIIGSVAGDKNLFREEDYAGYREISNEEFEAWSQAYLDYSASQGLALSARRIPYIMRYKGEVVPHYIAMTAVQNRDPGMWADAANYFGDDFEQTYLMMDHGLSTELSRGKMKDDLILYSGLYDSQLMAAAGTDYVPSQQELVEAIGSSFSDPIMISTTTDPAVAAGFGDTLFVIYASREAMEALGAICIDAVSSSSEKEILMNDHAQYRILDVGNMAIVHQDPWEEEPSTLYRAYVKVELLAPEQPAPEFEDVPEDAYYHDAVCWAAENGVASGTGEGKFSPKNTCTRAELLTMLWRAAGAPDASEVELPFTDANADDYWYHAAQWAYREKITTGATATTFGPKDPCTRAQTVSFLWAAQGKPQPELSENPFTDLKPGKYYYKAAMWAYENGVTSGATATTFAPNKTCTRAQAVTFLYKVFGHE